MRRVRAAQAILLLAAQVAAHPELSGTNFAANPLVKGAVNAATEALRFLGVGTRPPPTNVPPGVAEIPVEGDVDAVLDAIRADFSLRAYFVTGVLSDGIYAEDCYFGDPTIAFTGRELWKRNLALLVPFLEEPSIELQALDVVDLSNSSRGALLKARWVLRTGLRLPWRPYVVVNGSTEYELVAPENNRIVRHVEAWDVDGWEALALLFRPGNGRR